MSTPFPAASDPSAWVVMSAITGTGGPGSLESQQQPRMHGSSALRGEMESDTSWPHGSVPGRGSRSCTWAQEVAERSSCQGIRRRREWKLTAHHPPPPGHRWALTTAGMEAGGAGAAKLLRWPLATQAGRDRGFQQAPHKNGRRARAYKHGFKQQVTPHN